MRQIDADVIEGIVGVERHPTLHYGRAVSAEKMVYILHSGECFEAFRDLRECPYSISLARLGINVDKWVMDEPLALAVYNGELIPREILP